MSEQVAQKLDEARALIEKGWCQKFFATTADGHSVSEGHPEAACWCSAGAIFKGTPYYEANDVIHALELVIDEETLDWNDAPERTQAEVIEAFKRAAELARAS